MAGLGPILSSNIQLRKDELQLTVVMCFIIYNGFVNEQNDNLVIYNLFSKFKPSKGKEKSHKLNNKSSDVKKGVLNEIQTYACLFIF